MRDQNGRAAARRVVDRLLDLIFGGAVDSTGRKMDKQLKSAVKAGCKYVLFIGEKELKSSEYNLKELVSGHEQQLSVEQVIEVLQKSDL